MKRVLAIFHLSMAAILLTSCGGNNSSKNGTALPTIPVRTLTVIPGTIELTREFSGGLEGFKQADLPIRLSEAVIALPHKIGYHVREGDVLVALDKGGASSQYLQAKANFDNAEKNYRKMKYLFDEKAISETQFDQSDAMYQVAKANFEAAKEVVEITSPINGIVVELNVKIGDVPPLGTLAARVAQTDSLRMSFGVPEDVVARFEKGKVGSITVASSDTLYECRVSKVADAADPATRAFSVDVTIPNPGLRLQPGTFAAAHFVVDSRQNALTVPQNALISTEGIMSLYVIKNDTARVRTVSTGVTNGSIAEIVAGLSAGEEVVVLGQSFLSDGYPIVRSKE